MILDFGSPVLLTDLMIPSCSDLVSLSVDIWTKNEESDGTRLVVAGDIGYKPLVVSDLQPPPVCRFLKVFSLNLSFLQLQGSNRVTFADFFEKLRLFEENMRLIDFFPFFLEVRYT